MSCYNVICESGYFSIEWRKLKITENFIETDFNSLEVKYSTFFLLAILILVTSCEVDTSEPEEVYSHWTNGATAADVELLKGKYWQSAHWTKEYVMFLKLKPTKEWWRKFKEVNNFEGHRIDVVDVSKSAIFEIDAPEWIEEPDWFTPDKSSEVYGQFGGSKYFWDPEKGILFIYEIQL